MAALAAAFVANFVFNAGLYQACMLAERRVSVAARVVPYTTKYGVCYYSPGEHWLLANGLYVMVGLFAAVALFYVAAKPVRTFDFSTQQFRMQREQGPQSIFRAASFLAGFVVLLAWICWG